MNINLSGYEKQEIKEKKRGKIIGFSIGTFASWTLILCMGLGMWGCPKYNVWQQELEGKAEFKRAEQNRLIQIEEAKANLESQKLHAQSEVERAKGMAEAIAIENKQLTSKYIQYLWVRKIDQMKGQKIYIPTEANIPILEAKTDSKE